MGKVREMVERSLFFRFFLIDPFSAILLIVIEIMIVIMAGVSLYLMLVPDPLIN